MKFKTLAELKQHLINNNAGFAGIYKITNVTTGAIYIGQTIRPIIDRIIEHITNPYADKSAKSIDNAIKRLGWEAFEFEVEIPMLDPTVAQLWFNEQMCIAKYDSYNHGYNLTKGNHTGILPNIKKYGEQHIVPVKVAKLIPIDNSNKTIIHGWDQRFIDYTTIFKDCEVLVINENFVEPNKKGELEEDGNQLIEYITAKLDEMKAAGKTNLGEVISNHPYGPRGAKLTQKIIEEFDFTNFWVLTPGYDLFTKEQNWKHIDTSFKPVIFRNGWDKDSDQVTVLVKLQKEENKSLDELAARLFVSVATDGDIELETAIKEFVFKVHLNKTLDFTRINLKYDPDWFVFNSGGHEIEGGGLQLKTRKGDDFNAAVKFNIFGEDANSTSKFPAAKITGCKDFIRLIYSEDGLKFIKVLFNAFPENWGFNNGLFADIDYTNCTTIVDLFNRLGLSSESQVTLLAAIRTKTLTKKELEVCDLAASF